MVSLRAPASLLRPRPAARAAATQSSPRLPPSLPRSSSAGTRRRLLLLGAAPLLLIAHPQPPARASCPTTSGMDALVDKLKREGAVTTGAAERALRMTDRAHYVARDAFVDPSYARACAYLDHPLPIGLDQTISAPHMHAHCLSLLTERGHIRPTSAVLDVGSGSGFFCAALAHIAHEGMVVGIDIYPQLVSDSLENLRSDPNARGLLERGVIRIHQGDGWSGRPADGPYDAIHVGAAAAEVPDALIEQLAPGGRLVMPVGPRGGQQMVVLDKSKEGKLSQSNTLRVNYVPLQKNVL